MARSRERMRTVFGTALRQLRQAERLSLDDVQRATAAHGVTVSRSHLSRVETGSADLNLPRFLVLLRALGAPAGTTVESFDGLLDVESSNHDPAAVRQIAEQRLHEGDAGGAARALRAALAEHPDWASPALVALWVGAEVRCARFAAADAVLQRFGTATADRPVERLARSRALLRLAHGDLLWARFWAIAAHHAAPGPLSTLTLAASDAAAGQIDRALDQVASPAVQSWDVRPRLLAGLIAGRCCLGRGQWRAAAQISASCRALACDDPWLVAELLLLESGVLAASNRPSAAALQLEAARQAARKLASPGFLAHTHWLAVDQLKRAGDLGGSHQAQRSARSLMRRLGTDVSRLPALPLFGLAMLSLEEEAG